MNDSVQQHIRDQVCKAVAGTTPLIIRGGGSKEFLGRPTRGDVLDVSSLRGIVRYEPTELVLTARAGTSLAEIEGALDAQRQMLPFEPPRFGPSATLGGTIACGLSGPARPFLGAARDYVLGTQIINGKGEIMRFGGEVMKNVAGYDVSRLMCGAYGTLGVLLEISLKVLPRPEAEVSLSLEMDADEALARMAAWQREPLPLTGLCYDGDRLHVRLGGAHKAVATAQHRIGGEPDPRGMHFWERLREQRSAFFEGAGDLWRIAVPPTAPRLKLAGKQLIDWGGGLRWVKTEQAAESVFAIAQNAGGHAQLVRGRLREDVMQPLPPALEQLHRRVKQAFDPFGVFNPGRMYAGI